jgi:PilZ domain
MIFGRNTPKRACMIKDVSEGGACLHIGLLLDPPERFTLTIRAVGNFCRVCQLVWRSEFDVGVKFVQRAARDHFY